ncbi:TDRKH protein, partial [Piaya cayana]|nr:TDRKH protein [Piaya cayana]
PHVEQPAPSRGEDVQLTLVGDKELEFEVRVPRAAVKSIIGRKGATIKKLRWETGARIEVEDEDEDEEVTLLISGSPEQVCRAKAAVHQIVKESMPVSEQLCVPQRAVGRIIGRGGETVQGIQRSSGAKVFCERNAGLAPVRVIQLSGTQKEVAAAKKLIMEKLMEDNAFRKELGESTAARCLRKQPLGSRNEPLCRCRAAGAGLPEPGEEEEGGSSWDEGSHLSQAPVEEVEDLEDGSDEAEELAAGPEAVVPKFEGGRSAWVVSWVQQENRAGKWIRLGTRGMIAPSGSHWGSCASPAVPSPDFSFQPDEHLEVYVSAAESPGRFWIQLIGQRSLQLDKLTAEMRQLYQSGACGVGLPVLQPGDIVAAPYMDGGDWHRARILDEQPDGSLRLCFVDFGDIGEVPPAALRALRSDFLSLPFQAIECSLAGVTPAGELWWDEAALEAFTRLTHCAAWQPLLARVSSYAAAGISTRLNVRLYSTLAGESLDIGAELVRLGHAVTQ